MKKLVEDIAKALVDIPEAVSVRVVEGELATVLELKVAGSDLGKSLVSKAVPPAPSALLLFSPPRG
jgi:predicted RNA-binding protein YlqC (UPF0109 family)